MRLASFTLVLLAAAPALAQLPPARLDRDRITVLEPIAFETGGAVFAAGTQRVLDAVLQILRANPGLRIEIGVHTDDRGAEAYNLRISQERADAIRAYLVSHGIAAGRLRAVGYGESRPLDTNSTTAGRDRNRRVELLIAR